MTASHSSMRTSHRTATQQMAQPSTAMSATMFQVATTSGPAGGLLSRRELWLLLLRLADNTCGYAQVTCIAYNVCKCLWWYEIGLMVHV